MPDAMTAAVAVDCRMTGGVGTILQNITPLIADRVKSLFLLGDPGQIPRWGAFPASTRVVPFTSRVYGVGEQMSFPLSRIRTCGLLHVPHINVPLRRLPFPLVVSINDAAHLSGALPIRSFQLQAARFYYRQAARRACHIITLSEFSKREIVERLNVAPEKITVIPCGVNPSHFSPRGEDAFQKVSSRLQIRRPYLMVLGSVRPHKNVGRVLEAFSLLKSRMNLPHQLVIVGEREGFRINAPLPRLSPSVEREVVFTGFVGEEGVAALYSFAEVFIFASIYEGFGLPPLEAMSCGAPVAVSRAASLPEVVGDAGRYFDPLSVEHIAHVVEELLNDPSERNRLAAAGRERARQFPWEKSARQYLQMYMDFGRYPRA